MSKIKYGVFGDVHFMHDRTPTSEIIQNFSTMFNDYKPGIMSQCNILFNAGDLFDQIRNADDDDFLLVVSWMNRFMMYCQQYNIKLRFLKGTPSHDGFQQSISEILAQNFPTLDFKYIDDISIEFIPDLGIHVLYIPDECRDNNRIIFEDVQQLMMEKGLTHVDLAIMHGAFKFQINFDSGSNRLHYEDDYLRIVKHYVNIAHIHTHRVYERILGQGSFTRLSHGEEEDKGMMVMDIDTEDPSKDRFTFIKNVNAKQYVTIKLRDNDVEKALSKLDKVVSTLKPGSYLRIQCKIDHPLYAAFGQLKSRYPHINVTKDRLDKKVLDKKEVFLETSSSYIPLVIDNTNIVNLIMERIPKSTNYMLSLNLHSELNELVEKG